MPPTRSSPGRGTVAPRTTSAGDRHARCRPGRVPATVRRWVDRTWAGPSVGEQGICHANRGRQRAESGGRVMLVAVRVSTIGSVDVGVAVTFVGVAGVAAGLATGVLLARRHPRSRSV